MDNFPVIRSYIKEEACQHTVQYSTKDSWKFLTSFRLLERLHVERVNSKPVNKFMAKYQNETIASRKVVRTFTVVVLNRGTDFFSQSFHHFKEVFGRSENRPIQGLKVYLLFF